MAQMGGDSQRDALRKGTVFHGRAAIHGGTVFHGRAALWNRMPGKAAAGRLAFAGGCRQLQGS